MRGYFEPSKGLSKSPVLSFSILVACMIGILGVTFGGGWLAPRACIKFKNATVLAAAPTNLIRNGPENLKLAREYAPPPYTKLASEKTQFLQAVPSKKKTVRVCKLKFSKDCVSPGTEGTPL